MIKINKKSRVVVLQPIPIKGLWEPMPASSKIELDLRYPINLRTHGVYFQQGKNYGTVGDRFYYIDQEELISFVERKIIKII